MEVGIIGLGRMGANMARRWMRAGHRCVVFGRHERTQPLAAEGALATSDLQEFVAALGKPRVVWLMVPVAAVDTLLQDLQGLMEPGDILIDGGNSYYHDDIRRGAEAETRGLHYVDVGTSGGVWGLERGYCLMIGGESAVVSYLDPLFRSLAPGIEAAPRSAGRKAATGTAELGYLHCGPGGAGHFVKMVHNGIEYGLMAAYAEGFNILHHANEGRTVRATDAETTPLRHPEHYQYDIPVEEVAELWRRGSVVASWLLDLIAVALAEEPDLSRFGGRVSDSGEGRWTVQAAVEEGVPVPVISAALFARFGSRGRADFSDRLLSAMRYQFGGHEEKSEPG